MVKKWFWLATHDVPTHIESVDTLICATRLTRHNSLIATRIKVTELLTILHGSIAWILPVVRGEYFAQYISEESTARRCIRDASDTRDRENRKSRKENNRSNELFPNDRKKVVFLHRKGENDRIPEII